MIIAKETSPGSLEPRVPFTPITAADGTQYPEQIIDLWADSDLKELGIYRVQEPPVPEGKVLVSFELRLVDGVPVYVGTYSDLPPPPKLKASARQIRLALNALELRDAIETYVASQGIEVKDSWEFTTEFEEDHPLIQAGQAALGITNEQVHDIFALAVTL